MWTVHDLLLPAETTINKKWLPAELSMWFCYLQQAKSHGQSLQEAIYRAQQSLQKARDCGQSWQKPTMTDGLCRRTGLYPVWMMDTCTGHCLSTLIIDNWVIEIVSSCNTKNCAMLIRQILKNCPNVMCLPWDLFACFELFWREKMSPLIVERML